MSSTLNNQASNSVGVFCWVFFVFFSDYQNKTERKQQSHIKCQVWKKALSGEGDDWTVQYSQAAAITMIGFTLRNIWLSKQNAGCIRATALC